MGAAQTRKLLKKLDQNFPPWVQRVHWRLIGRTQNVNLDNPRLKVFGATFFQKGSKKFLTQANSLIRFFFDTKGAKKKA